MRLYLLTEINELSFMDETRKKSCVHSLINWNEKKNVKYKTYYLKLNRNISLCNRISMNVETQHRSFCGISKVMGYIEALIMGTVKNLMR